MPELFRGRLRLSGENVPSGRGWRSGVTRRSRRSRVKPCALRRLSSSLVFFLSFFETGEKLFTEKVESLLETLPNSSRVGGWCGMGKECFLGLEVVLVRENRLGIEWNDD